MCSFSKRKNQTQSRASYVDLQNEYWMLTYFVWRKLKFETKIESVQSQPTPNYKRHICAKRNTCHFIKIMIDFAVDFG